MAKPTPQPGILAGIPGLARDLSFHLKSWSADDPALRALKDVPAGGTRVVGLGSTTVQALGGEVPALRELPPLVGPGVPMPVTPRAVLLWLRGQDPGNLGRATHEFVAPLAPSFEFTQVIGAFRCREGRDLARYVDGTETPIGDEAISPAVADDGSSFLAVQQWVPDLGAFEALGDEERDLTFGRCISDNEEIEDAPESAHLKRTAQEDFEPPSSIVRRSMPRADGAREGIVFVAFGHSLDAFEELQRRTTGLDDGIVDALFRFTKPETGGTYRCPPLGNEALGLSALGL